VGNGPSLKRLIEEGLTRLDDIDEFRQDLWNLWSRLYLGNGTRFPYDTPDRDGIFFVASRKRYAKPAEGGDLVTYSRDLRREERYSRNIFNMKALDLRDAATGRSRTLYFISNEAPLLRPMRGRPAGNQRIHADLIAAADDGSLIVLEAKDDKESADPLPSAVLQAYSYAFFLACHLVNRREAVLDHARASLKKFHGTVSLPLAACCRVEYCVVAPRGYFERALANADPSLEGLLKALRQPLHIEVTEEARELNFPDNPVFSGFVISEMLCHRDAASLRKLL